MSDAPSVLLIEPYYGGSHRIWADGVVSHCGHPVDLITHPARWWKWRMRGAAVTLAERCADLTRPPAAVLMSDMVDVAAFRTFARPYLGDAPVGVYFHETQLGYPDSPQTTSDVHFAVTNWTSALAADRVYFNSEFHRRSFFDETPRLLRHFPDLTHEHLIAGAAAKAQVLEVGVDLSWVEPTAVGDGPVRIVWNHRWEHDKDPQAFFAAVDVLAGEGLDFEVVVLGENFRVAPDEFAAAAARHGDRILHMGLADLDAYRKWLNSADVVVSTALQEFFGVSVVEGMAAGCMPVLPARLSYPELVPVEQHELCLYPEGGLVDRLRWVIVHPGEAREVGRLIAPSMVRFGWDLMGPRYRDALEELMGSAR